MSKLFEKFLLLTQSRQKRFKLHTVRIPEDDEKTPWMSIGIADITLVILSTRDTMKYYAARGYKRSVVATVPEHMYEIVRERLRQIQSLIDLTQGKIWVFRRNTQAEDFIANLLSDLYDRLYGISLHRRSNHQAIEYTEEGRLGYQAKCNILKNAVEKQIETGRDSFTIKISLMEGLEPNSPEKMKTFRSTLAHLRGLILEEVSGGINLTYLKRLDRLGISVGEGEQYKDFSADDSINTVKETTFHVDSVTEEKTILSSKEGDVLRTFVKFKDGGVRLYEGEKVYTRSIPDFRGFDFAEGQTYTFRYIASDKAETFFHHLKEGHLIVILEEKTDRPLKLILPLYAESSPKITVVRRKENLYQVTETKTGMVSAYDIRLAEVEGDALPSFLIQGTDVVITSTKEAIETYRVRLDKYAEAGLITSAPGRLDNFIRQLMYIPHVRNAELLMLKDVSLNEPSDIFMQVLI